MIDFSKVKMLIVDNDKMDSDLIKKVAKDRGVTNIIRSSSGEDALSKINSMSTLPDLIMLDLDLSNHDMGMNGVDVLHELRQNKRTKDIKIVTISGNIELLSQTGSADLQRVKRKYSELKAFTNEALDMLE